MKLIINLITILIFILGVLFALHVSVYGLINLFKFFNSIFPIW